MLIPSAITRRSAALLIVLAGTAAPALALKNDPAGEAEDKTSGEQIQRIPLDAMTPKPGKAGDMSPAATEPEGETNEPGEAEGDAEEQPGKAEEPGAPGVQEQDQPPAIITDPAKLPEPVRRMRRLIMDAARTGNVERLRPLLGSGDNGTQISLSEVPDDPIEFLRSLSGDPKGYEILAILLEVMEAPAVELAPGTDEAIYVWPYFVAVPLDKLTPPQMVELMTLVTAGDYEAMEEFGAYNFYRVGITPEGEWVFFVAGD